MTSRKSDPTTSGRSKSGLSTMPGRATKAAAQPAYMAPQPCRDLSGAYLLGSTSFLVTSSEIASRTHDQRHTYLSSLPLPFVRCPIAGKQLGLAE